MESVNNQKKKNKLLRCFRSVATVKAGRTDCSGDQVFKYIAVGDNKENIDVVIPTVLSSFSNDNLKVSNEEVVVEGRRRKKTKFSRILKAVFFETFLAKKIRNKESRKDSFRSNSNLSTKTDNEKSMSRASTENNDRRFDSFNSSSSRHPSALPRSSSLCSSCSSPITLNSRSSSLKKAPFRSNSIELKQRHSGGYYGLCLLLISLLVLIFWGRICAIFCTSTWLFFMPRRSFEHDSPVNGVELMPEIETMQYKKRVIMEGLLERNRSRVVSVS